MAKSQDSRRASEIHNSAFVDDCAKWFIELDRLKVRNLLKIRRQPVTPRRKIFD
jgi:hypothetical protein